MNDWTWSQAITFWCRGKKETPKTTGKREREPKRGKGSVIMVMVGLMNFCVTVEFSLFCHGSFKYKDLNRRVQETNTNLER